MQSSNKRKHLDPSTASKETHPLAYPREMLKGFVISKQLQGNPISNSILMGKVPAVMYLRNDLSRGSTLPITHNMATYHIGAFHFLKFVCVPTLACRGGQQPGGWDSHPTTVYFQLSELLVVLSRNEKLESEILHSEMEKCMLL